MFSENYPIEHTQPFGKVRVGDQKEVNGYKVIRMHPGRLTYSDVCEVAYDFIASEGGRGKYLLSLVDTRVITQAALDLLDILQASVLKKGGELRISAPVCE